ncbi:hypothetical protein SARC_02427 [Sphaeroforma arctica JP610]|uniref:Uncharacterized protein n=1 Tax=Sphaeroforma arctica JP610 TaxID=667725 RepID=A0A0L0G940_9EUKA|nr:hypothetical protein SARC_02427 [Sphaeroforma arctica JP610]KNC85396.1 hypothetical protein SARC_02427 [Sphaeroforma arctica JP610]|eukprot:XP_014159298.1 hypothetical protein SARC_02427 [Sphaeroforma arctica JP610]
MGDCFSDTTSSRISGNTPRNELRTPSMCYRRRYCPILSFLYEWKLEKFQKEYTRFPALQFLDQPKQIKLMVALGTEGTNVEVERWLIAHYGSAAYPIKLEHDAELL